MAVKYPGSPERINELLAELHTQLDQVETDGAYAELGEPQRSSAIAAKAALAELTEEWKLTGLGKLLAGEPYFPFLGRDVFTPVVIEQYAAMLAASDHGLHEQAQDLIERAQAVRVWQTENRASVKVPD